MSNSNLYKTPDLKSRQTAKFLTPSTPSTSVDSVEEELFNTPLTPITPVSPISTYHHELFSKSDGSKNLQEELILSDLMIPSDQFKISGMEKLGQGTNSIVYKIDEFDNIVLKVSLTSNKNKILRRESLILNKIQQENDTSNFVKLFGVYQFDDKFSIILEKLDMDLHSFINIKQNGIGSNNWYNLFNTLIDSLSYLQKLEIVHCDLKTSNILIDTNKQVFKICDFSSSKFIYESSLEIDTTLQFLAPELLSPANKCNHNFETDLYSAGLILLHALTGKQPYQDFINGSLLQLINLIKKNSVLKLLDINSVQILDSNPDISNILHKIIIQRCHLGEL